MDCVRLLLGYGTVSDNGHTDCTAGQDVWVTLGLWRTWATCVPRVNEPRISAVVRDMRCEGRFWRLAGVSAPLRVPLRQL